MRFPLSIASIFVVLIPFPVSALLAKTPICNGTCSPDPTSTTYSSGTVQARPLPRNQRGRSSVLSGPTHLWFDDTAGPPLPGSASFTSTIPILSLPGRNGLNVNLTLYYDSAIWTIDPANSTATLNADRDFPTYGFRMGYGMIEGPFTNEVGTSSYLLTEPDGTKRELRFIASPNTYESFDNTFVDFNNSTLTLSRKNGTQWKCQAVTGTTFFVPIQIEDTNGNYITITYNTGTGFSAQAINTITDTLGRVITFNYDANTHLPVSITVPAFGGTGTATVATFTYSQVALNYNYTLTVTDTVATGTTINVLTQCRYANGTGYNFYYITATGAW